MRTWRLLIPALAAVSFGCTKSEVTEADAAKVKSDFSQQSYEDAMRKSGRGKELEEQKAREAARDQGSGQ